MKQRGRRSAVAMEVLSATASVLDRVERVRPPHDLTDEETEVWASIVNSEPADWFSASSLPLLADYCRHVVHARRIAELLERALSDLDPATKQPTLKVEDYDRLLKMQERESRILVILATKMRICQSSTINQRGNKKPNSTRKPWEG